MNWIVLDFGTHEIKALKLRFEGQRLEILDFTEIPSRPEFFKGLAYPEQAAWNAVTIHLNEIEWIKPNEEVAVLAALPSAYLETRYLKFPFKNEKKIEKVLQFELESTLPFDVEDVHIRHKLLDGEGVGASKEGLVLTFCYKRDIIKNFEAELRKFQISVPSMTSEILAFSALRAFLPPEPVVGLLEIGHSKTHFLLMQKNGSIIGMRTFWWGGQRIIQSIAEDLHLDFSRAEEIFWQFDPSKDKSLISSLNRALLMFGTEFKQTLKGMKHSGLLLPAPLPVYVLGGVTRTSDFIQYLEGALTGDFPVSARSFPIDHFQSKQVVGFHKLKDPDKGISTLAVAMCQLRNFRGRIPAFSESGFQFQQNLQKIKTGSFTVLRKVAILLIFPLLYSAFQFYVQQHESKIMVSKLAEVLERSGMKVGADETTDQIKDRLRKERSQNRVKLDQLAEDDSSPLLILSQISDKIPLSAKIDVKDFRVSSELISITAETDTVETANQIADSLRSLYPDLKMGAVGTCKDKTNCKSFTLEAKREAL